MKKVKRVRLIQDLEEVLTKQGKIRTHWRSGYNTPNAKVVRSCLLVNGGKKKHYTGIKNLSRQLQCLSVKQKRRYCFSMNCLNGFSTVLSTRHNHYANCVDPIAVKIEMLWKENNMSIKSIKMVSISWRFHLSYTQTLKIK